MSDSSSRKPRITDRKENIVRRFQDHRSHQIFLMSEPKILICLISRGVHDRVQSSNQTKAQDWFHTRKVPHTVIDGMDPAQREIRNKLFEISGIRGNYPQFFFEFEDGAINFLGNFDKVDDLNETTGLPAEILAQHPDLETWDKMFGSVVESFD
mmetsp:Transcript_32455/g.59860  ORF Transcript_32455/g.59860 Transcript_32455/m.59860 type:complete len:154 (+) Transcript_32455:320-781(+)